MRRSLALLAIALLGVGANACGGASEGARTSTTKSSEPARTGGDRDYPDRGYDGDDGPAPHFGHAASAGQRRLATLLLRHYYEAAAARDGRRACSLMAVRLAKAMVESYSRSEPDPRLRGKPCPVIMSAMFTRLHKQFVREGATLGVTGVRVKGNEGYLLLHTNTMPVGSALVLREHGTWRLGLFPGTFA